MRIQVSSHSQTLAALVGLMPSAWRVLCARLEAATIGLIAALVVSRYSPVQLGNHTLGSTPAMLGLAVALGLLSSLRTMILRAFDERRIWNDLSVAG